MTGHYLEQCLRLIEAITTHLPDTSDEAPYLSDFTRHFYDGLPLADLEQIPAAIGADIAQIVYSNLAKRNTGTPDIHISTPDFLSTHYHRQRIAISVINNDMPFLVDSLSMALKRLGFTIYRTIHPQLYVDRDNAGILTGMRQEATEDSLTESCIYFELSPLPENMSKDDLRAQLITTLQFVQHAVKDWRVMMAKAREVSTHIVTTDSILPKEDIEEACDFFDWLLSKNFIFLGFVEYDFYDKDGNECFTPVFGSELGVFKVDHTDLLQRGLSCLPPEVRHFALQRDPVEITKSNRHSRVHRDVPMDYIGIKRYNTDGNVIGESRFLGLFTSPVYYQKTQEIPYIRRKVSKVIEDAGFDKSGHSGKALQAALEFFPRDELFQISVEDLLTISLGIVSLEERPDIGVFFRRDRFERFMSCFVYMPRDKYNTFVRQEIGRILERHLKGTISVFYSQITDSPLARVNFIIQTQPGHIPSPDQAVLQQELRFVINFWIDSLRDALQDELGEKRGERLYRQYIKAFPKSYINTTPIPAAIEDIELLEQVTKQKQTRFYLFKSVKTERWHLKMYSYSVKTPLSDILPIFENTGFKVRDVVHYEIHPVIEDHKNTLLIRDFTLIPQSKTTIPFTEMKSLVEDVLAQVWVRQAENDSLNALAMTAGLSARQITMIRAYMRYAKQANLGYSDTYIAQTLCKHASLTRLLVELFETRFNPATAQQNNASGGKRCYQQLIDGLTNVDNLAEDKIIRFFADTMQATLRTNFYQHTTDNTRKDYLSFKLDSVNVPGLPLPRPFREIFVYSMTTEGIHLRGGEIARGGLRWSDRLEDFRTEVLGLMKAQLVKNTVIVPTGSKGGFVVKHAEPFENREARQEAGIASYRQFLSGMLDITDNRRDEQIIRPEHTVCYDKEDPYLVVAADKGTATFSDIANALSHDYRFWLDDAFASGGSVGYDHKKMGITARGAWVSVQQHFLEMGNTMNTPFTVAGIGDMSGDVFGNGMLLSRNIQLVAAFNHLHIFIDPTPDPAISFTERERLFTQASGSWDQYKADLISQGGGVFSRTLKTIALTPQMQQLLGTDITEAAPSEIIRLILKAPVDLLWNGGIGTYVKASYETDDIVGDPGNNNVRINGNELRCKIVGEGGNLGLTQHGRIEYARHGGHINTDAIDNSAGVDCSDHEVNIKIALGKAVEQQDMTMEARNTLLASMTDEVAELVLEDNRQQNNALSVAECHAPQILDLHTNFIQTLEREGILDRKVEFLPNDKQLTDLKAANLGLTRPEIAVLLAYSKISLYKTLSQSHMVSSDLFEDTLLQYFPSQLQSQCKTHLLAHPLRSNIVATILTNDIINRAGITYVHSIQHDTGHEVCNIVRAYVVVCEIFDLYHLWDGIEALKDSITGETHMTLMVNITRFLERMSLWFLSNCPQPLDIEKTLKQYGERIKHYTDTHEKFLSDSMRDERLHTTRHWIERHVPESISKHIANLESLISACDIAMIDQHTPHSMEVVGTLYYELGARLQLGWLRMFVATFPAETRWEKLAIHNAINELYEQQRRLSEAVIITLCDDDTCHATIDRWVEANHSHIQRFQQLVREIRSSEQHDLSMLIVVLRQLSSIRALPET